MILCVVLRLGRDMDKGSLSKGLIISIYIIGIFTIIIYLMLPDKRKTEPKGSVFSWIKDSLNCQLPVWQSDKLGISRL